MIDLELAAACLRGFEPPPSVKWFEWARNGGIIIPAKVATPRKGAYDVWFTPALVGPAEALATHGVWQVVIKKGSQGGGTQMGFSWLASMAVLDPEQAMVVMGNVDLVRQRSKNTFLPMIRASPEVFAQVEDGKDALALQEYNFKGCIIMLVGGNSPTGLSGNPVVRMHVSEENKAADDKEEGSSVELAIERTKNFPQRKIYRECTPSIPGKGISKAYDDGTQEEMHVPCPKCDTRAMMGFHKEDGGHYIQFDSTLEVGLAAKSSAYVCAACSHPWTNAERLDMLDRAARMENNGYIGKRTVEQTGGIRSFHYPSQLSPMVTTADLVTKFLRVKDTPSELKTFVTGWLGKDWSPDIKRVADENLVSCRMAYDLGEPTNPYNCEEIRAKCQDLPSVITIFADVQKSGMWVLVRRWWKGGASALLSFRFVDSYAKVREIEDYWFAALQAEAKTRDELKRPKIPLKLVVWIDSGDGTRQSEIGAAALKYGWTATKGSSTPMDTLFRESAFELETGWRTSDQATSVQQIIMDVSAAKMNLADRIWQMERAREGEVMGETFAPWWIPGNMPAGKTDYCGQVVSEQYSEETGQWDKRPGYKHNHALDCEVGAWICAYAYGCNSPILG